jgi:biotin carboxylase
MTGTTRKRLIILGAGVMQGPAIRLAKEMDLETVVVDGDPRAPWVSLADRFEHIDLKDKEGVEALGRRLAARGGLSGIMTAGTDFSATVAWVAERLGLPGIPYEAALNASDKERMRSCFQKAGVPSPDFTILRAPPEPDYTPPFGYPLVVKPVDNMGARGCRRVDGPGELLAAAAEALHFSRSGRAVVEEYMDGPEYSVDAILYKGEITICGLADRHIFFPPYFIETGHTMPALADKKTAEALVEVFIRGIKALGLAGPSAAGAAKGDLKWSSRGPMIGEIAARLSGGYMSGWTYPYASGVEVTRGAIFAALGLEPRGLGPVLSRTSAERAFISIPGRIRSVHGTEEAKALPWVRDLFLRVEPGSQVRFPENNVTKCGNIITAAPDRETAVAAAEGGIRAIRLRLSAPEAETDRFLGIDPLGPGASFPPNAFPFPEALALPWRALPETPACSGGGIPDLTLIPFPEFTGSALRDYTGRTVEESLETVRELTGCSLAFAETSRETFFLGREFWAALIRGGYQGAAYLVDRFLLGFPQAGKGE